MKIDQHSVNSISWVDLAASDLSAQVSFYRQMMGWTADEYPGSDYVTLLSDDEPVAGALPMPDEMDGMPSVWSVYINVGDAKATCEAARAAGGAVIREPFEIPGEARVAVVSDPAGAAVCLFEGAGDAGFRVLDEPGAPCWFESMSRDAKAAVPFYEQVFGWTATPMEGAPTEYYTFSVDDGDQQQAVGGLMQLDEATPDEVPSFWQVSFSIGTDIDSFIAQATALGARVLMGPMHTQFGSGAVVADPAGAFFVAFDRSAATT